MLHLSLDDFRDKHAGEQIAILAPGPSLRQLEHVSAFSVAIFIGDAHLRTNLRAKFNYYVRANTEFPRLDSSTDIDPFFHSNFAMFIASSVMESDVPVQDLARETGIETYLFDQRHFGGLDCAKRKLCCDAKLGPTIQEYLSDVFGMPHHYSPGSTVLLHALALALIGGAERIKVFGASLPTRQVDYFYAGEEGHRDKTKLSAVTRISLAAFLNILRSPRDLRFRIAGLFLGKDAPSIFAEDIIETIADLQFISDIASLKGIRLEVASDDSTLGRIHGFRITDPRG